MYRPIIRRVWASNPGKAVKKNPTTGKRINSNGEKTLLHKGKPKTLGFERRSIKITANKLTILRVRMAEDT